MFNRQFLLNAGGDQTESALESLLGAVKERRFDASSCFAIRLALEEALSNAFKHGNRNDPRKVVRMECVVDRDTVKIDIEDEGDGFDPMAVPDPTQQENLEIPCGRGLVLMKAFMSEVVIHPPGNRIRMVYQRPGEATSA